MNGWFSEFRRRNVFKVSAAYLIVAWLLIQFADIMAPQLDLPEWAPRLVTYLLLTGFPIAIVFAWIFDLTPEGIQVDDDHSRTHGVLIFAGLIIVALLASFLWDWTNGTEKTSDVPSIAVMPFVNMSGDADTDYFSEGISEELLNRLAHIPELRVAARTSSFSFKDSQLGIPDIARELNVTMVIEGSVRRQDDRVRITVQLIDAKSGFHRWSENYDRDLKDVFAIQDEIAMSVASELRLQIAPNSALSDHSLEIDPASFDRYLRARVLIRDRGNDSLRTAIKLLEQVIAAEPDFAAVYSELAVAYAVLPFYSSEARIAAHEKSRNAAEHALALDPRNAEAYGALGDVAVHAMRFDTADVLLRRAISLAPSFPAAHYWLAENFLYRGDPEAALIEHDIARTLDPLSRAGGVLRSYSLLALDRIEEAREACEIVLDDAPAYVPCQYIMLLIALGSSDESLTEQLLINPLTPVSNTDRQLRRDLVSALSGRTDKQPVINWLIETPYHEVYRPDGAGAIHDAAIPGLLVKLGEPELALDRLERSATREPKDVFDAIWDPGLDAIRCNDRFQAIVTSLSATDPRAETMCNAN